MRGSLGPRGTCAVSDCQATNDGIFDVHGARLYDNNWQLDGIRESVTCRAVQVRVRNTDSQSRCLTGIQSTNRDSLMQAIAQDDDRISFAADSEPRPPKL